MAFLPYTNILIGPTHTIATAGSHILVLDNLTGVLNLNLNLEQTPNVGPVRCIDVDSTGRYIAAVGDDKVLRLWEMEEQGVLKVVNQRDLPKKPTKVKFTKDGQTILVSDKFGDVFSYPLLYEPPPQDVSQQKQKDALSSHENPSNGLLVLGHASPLNFFVLTDDERYIFTADRDEHIRVSHFPKGYIIEMYCLGHTKFVSALHIIPSEPALLISGGGDTEIKVWDWMNGSLLWQLSVWEVVENYLVVHAVKRSGWEEDGDDEKPPKGKRKRKGKEKEQADNGDGGDGENDSPDVSVDEPGKLSKILVIQQIGSIVSDTMVYAIFSAVGATALFAFPFKLEVQPNEILHFDFRKPVLSFTIVGNEAVVVTLDGEWSDSEAEAVTGDKAFVKVMGISSGQFKEHIGYGTALIESLNSKALVSASAAEVKSLDLYSALTTLPKHSSDRGIEVPFVPIGAPELSASNYKARAKSKAQDVSKKEMGRMKGKMKVLEKVKDQEENLVRKRDEEGDSEKRSKKRIK